MVAEKENLYFNLIRQLMVLTRLGFVLILLLANNIGLRGQERWEIGETATVEFSGKKAEGSFSGLSGVIIFDADSLSSAYFDVAVDVATINTGNNLKNKHAKNESWFFAEQFPLISFKGKDVFMSNDQFVVEGQLELRGVRREARITFDFERENASKAIFRGSMSVNRSDFGIDGNMMAFVVGEDFEVLIQVPVTLISQ